MNEMTTIAPSAGADSLAIMTAPGVGQRDGIRLSSGRFSGPAVDGGKAGVRMAAFEHGVMAVLADVRIPTAARKRVLADDAYVPGAPPRGAPV